MRRLICLAFITALAGLVGPGTAAAQTAPGCPAGEVQIPSLGLSGWSCTNCVMFTGGHPADARWEFRSEPTVLAVDPDGPAHGRIEAGDVIVGVDGLLITTREGGRRIAQPEVGRPTELRIRRGGREIDVQVDATLECRPLPESRDVGIGVAAPRPAAPARPDAVPPSRRATAPRQPVAIDSVHVTESRVTLFPSPTGAVSLPALLPTGWLGLSFQCSRCEVQVVQDSTRYWTFSEPPEIVSVEPGSPAARVGLRSGDRIVAVEGQAITSAAGGRRFGAISPGERVNFEVERGGATRTVAVTAGSRARVTSVPSPTPPGAPSPPAPTTETVRYSGRMGDTLIDVTGEPVTVTRTESEIIIRSGDITVRLRRDTTR